MPKYLRQTISMLVLMAFASTSINMPAYAQITLGPWLPKPGTMVDLSPQFSPAQLKGMVIHPDNALKFDFIIDQGNSRLSPEEKQIEYKKLIKYFLASLAVPDQDQWVNLSPYEKKRIIESDFGQTLMGRDLLAEDYLLKQITSSLIYPGKDLGKKFWDKIYVEAQAKYGNTNVPVNIFNKVWIVPDKAVIYEKGNVAYVIENHLKVMLEEDYLSLQIHSVIAGPKGEAISKRTIHDIGSPIIREIVLPALEKEVNEGKNFALLRQIYSGMLLAAWYKRALKESLLAKVYADKAKVAGLVIPISSHVIPAQVGIRDIYNQYLAAFKKGVFNYIKEGPADASGMTVPRKYFSGGTEGYEKFPDEAMIIRTPDPNQEHTIENGISTADVATTDLRSSSDFAMEGHPGKNKKIDFGFDSVIDLPYDGMERMKLLDVGLALNQWFDPLKHGNQNLTADELVEYFKDMPAAQTGLTDWKWFLAASSYLIFGEVLNEHDFVRELERHRRDPKTLTNIRNAVTAFSAIHDVAGLAAHKGRAFTFREVLVRYHTKLNNLKNYVSILSASGRDPIPLDLDMDAGYLKRALRMALNQTPMMDAAMSGEDGQYEDAYAELKGRFIALQMGAADLDLKPAIIYFWKTKDAPDTAIRGLLNTIAPSTALGIIDEVHWIKQGFVQGPSEYQALPANHDASRREKIYQTITGEFPGFDRGTQEQIDRRKGAITTFIGGKYWSGEKMTKSRLEGFLRLSVDTNSFIAGNAVKIVRRIIELLPVTPVTQREFNWDGFLYDQDHQDEIKAIKKDGVGIFNRDEAMAASAGGEAMVKVLDGEDFDPNKNQLWTREPQRLALVASWLKLYEMDRDGLGALIQGILKGEKSWADLKAISIEHHPLLDLQNLRKIAAIACVGVGEQSVTAPIHFNHMYVAFQNAERRKSESPEVLSRVEVMMAAAMAADRAMVQAKKPSTSEFPKREIINTLVHLDAALKRAGNNLISVDVTSPYAYYVLRQLRQSEGVGIAFVMPPSNGQVEISLRDREKLTGLVPVLAEKVYGLDLNKNGMIDAILFTKAVDDVVLELWKQARAPVQSRPSRSNTKELSARFGPPKANKVNKTPVLPRQEEVYSNGQVEDVLTQVIDVLKGKPAVIVNDRKYYNFKTTDMSHLDILWQLSTGILDGKHENLDAIEIKSPSRRVVQYLVSKDFFGDKISHLRILFEIMKKLVSKRIEDSGRGAVLDTETVVQEAFADPAMRNLGGIDMDAAHMDLQIKRDGNGVPLPFNKQDMAQLAQIQGLEPEILKIQPAVNLPAIRELRQQLQTTPR